MTTDTNVTVLHSFKDVEPSDLRAGFLAYSVSERQVDQLQGQTAVWIFAAVYCIWDRCIQDPDITIEVAEKELTEQCQWLMSDAAGAMQLTAKQGKLTGNNSLARAWKKIKRGLEAGLKMSEFQTCSAMEVKVREMNKADEKAKRDERVESGINKKAIEMAKEEGIEEGTPEFTAKVDDLVKDMMKQFMSDKSPEAATVVAPAITINIDDKYKAQALEIMEYAQKKIAEALIELFRDTIPSITGNYTEEEATERAKDQMFEVVDGICSSWMGRADKHRTKLAARLSGGNNEKQAAAK